MKSKHWLRLFMLLSVLSFACFLFLYPSFPEAVPTNWNVYGEIDAYGGKGTLIFINAIVPLLTLGLYVLPYIDPLSRNYEKHKKAYTIITVACSLMLLLFTWALNLAGLGWQLPMGTIINVTVGVTFIVFGNWMPQMRPNFFMGIRTPWTITNANVWRKTHRLGGVVFCIFGIGMLLAAIVGQALPYLMLVMVTLMLIAAAGLIVYSYLYYKHERKKEEGNNNAKN